MLQAETLLAPKRESEAATRALEQLEALLKTPEPQTTLVLVAATLDKRSRMYKLLPKHATLVECGALEDSADAERWVRTRVAAAGRRRSSRRAARLIAQRAGTDVKRLRGDVDRLLLYALGQKTITVDDVREVVGPAALQDDWAMTNAIEAGQAAEALRQLALMLDAGAPAEKILGQLGWLVRTKFPALAPATLRPRDRGAVPHRPGPQAIGRRSARAARAAVVELCAGKRARRRVRRPRRSTRPLWTRRGDAGRQPRLVAAGGVAVNDALARHLVDERDRLFQRRFGARQIVAVDRGADALERVAQARAELAIALAVLQTLSMRFERGCVRSHVITTSGTPNHSTMALSDRALRPHLRAPAALHRGRRPVVQRRRAARSSA